MSRRAKTIKATRYATALLGCTALAGMPLGVSAQDAPATQAQPAETQAQPAQNPPAPAAQDMTVRTIAVAGAQRLEPQTIVSYIQLQPGMEYTAAVADQVLKDLAATELFADYSITFDNGNVVIRVVENPVINRIVLEGNKKIKDDKILPEIKLAPRQIFTRSKVRADVTRIIELYKRQGRFAATVEPKMVQLSQNRVDVVYEITEGPKSKVRAINIIGNEAFSDGDLKGEMITQEAGLLKIFSSGTSYDPDRLAFDQQKLRQFYLTEGYADFRVVSAVAELTPDKKDFIITYVVEEGERYKFGEVKVDSRIRDFDSTRLTAGLPMETGEWYNAKTVEDTVEQLSETAGAFGYAFADVRPEFERNPETMTMDITFTINESDRTYVERVDINGNTLTQDKVIRREFRVAEGDAFSSLGVKRTTARINSLGYFQENFEVTQVEGSSPDRIVLEANVQEQATGELSLSAGFSSLESFIFQGSIRQRNFRGRGQTIGLSANYSRFSQSASLSFTEPYVFDKNISAGIDIYRKDYNNGYFDRDSATFEQSTTGFQLRAGLPLTEYSSVLARYTLNIDDITVDESLYFADFDGDGISSCEPLLVGRYLCDAIGSRTSSILGLSFIYNATDNRIRPTRGQAGSVSLDVAGLGGSVRYARLTGNAAKYWNFGSGFIFSLSLETGVIKGLKDRGANADDVLLNDRFFLGEPQIRGFDIRGVGPRVVRRFYTQDGNGNTVLTPIDDERQSSTDALGGTGFYLGRAEVEIPLGSGARELGLRPSAFIDVGAVFGLKTPQLVNSPFPAGLFIPSRDENGNELFREDTLDNMGNVVSSDVVTNPLDPGGNPNTPLGRRLPPFVEEFYGNSPSPRVSIGIGVNWNSPFGPFRIDVAYPLLKQEGDETKIFSFNVGTQF
ncbi:outer membrane protein assembly factor BamA [Paraurantiacibacter namhicola]|uniref:Outer membrane protein assembly factor BamA n=1 Tax=Paraurantiacibacter namhicola TaxID=645517 RepID=A0A1C7DA02_9SPHN|nr:outer membrane protein assembly factor BamA [Paraurantiacibacter namhicola]ANU08255.1 Outer membrane protein assembly factor BamA precursor [Paraurantiacibacter namhicola]